MGQFTAKLKRILREPGYLMVLIFGAAAIPTMPGRVMVDDHAQGLRLLYTASNTSEADWLTQVLSEAGFHMEYVPSASTGMFGTSGNSSIYVREEQYDDALDFLNQYLEGEQEETT